MWEAEVQLKERRMSTQQLLDAIDALPPVSLEEGQRILDEICADVQATGASDMTMEEIDEEIAACRRERRERQAASVNKATPQSTIQFRITVG